MFVCVFVTTGCESNSLQWPGSKDKAVVKDIEPIPVEQKKADLLKRIDKKFEDATAHFELAKIYQSEGLWPQAEREYNYALNLDPVHREAQAGRVKVLTLMDDKAQAQTSTDFYVNQASTSAAGSLKLAMAFQEQGLDELAMRCYRQALNLAPNSAKIHRQLGFYYLAKDNKEMAREYLTRSFQLNPYQEDVGLALGRLGVVVKVPEKTQSGKKLDQKFE
jgi:Tfp pilus assembly protein PilF